MDKYVIEFTANEQKLKKTSCDKFASHTVSYVEAHFILGDNWSGFDSVSAVWTNGWETIATVLDSNGICIVPHEVLERRAEVRVNLAGSVADGSVAVERLTTFPVVALDVTKRAYVSGTETAEVTPSQFEQFVANVKAEADRAEDARDNAEAIKTEVEGLKADTEQIKTDTAQIKTETEAIKTATESLVDGFDDKVSEALEDISEAKTDALNGIGSAKTDALTDISSAKTDAVDDVTDEGTRQVDLVSSEGTSQISAVRTEGQTQVEAVQTEGETQVNAVRTEGGTQIVNIEQRGADVLSRIPYFAPIITDTAEGSIASFTDGADDYPMVSVVTEINPIQEGSGDPSSTNVRPISGWSGVNVNRRGKNILKLPTWEEITALPRVGNYSSMVIKCKPNTDYYLSSRVINDYVPSGSYIYVLITNNPNAESPFLSIVHHYDGIHNGVIRSTADGYLWLRISQTIESKWNRILESIETQLEEGSTATAYEPYQGTSKSIDFKDSQGNPITVYGGNMNITDGEGLNEMNMVDLGSLTWTKEDNGNRFSTPVPNTLKQIWGGQVINAICSMYKPTSRDLLPSVNNSFSVHYSSGSNYLNIHDDEAYSTMTAEQFKAHLNGQTMLCELQTPTPIYCEPTEIKSLKGNNNVWADTGDSNVEYCADTKLYIDKKINALI